MLSVAARLLGQARINGSFVVSAAALSEILDDIRLSLAEDEHLMMRDDAWDDALRDDYKVLVSNVERDSISLSCHFGSNSLFGRLRIDGTIDQRGHGIAVSLDDAKQRVELGPEIELVMPVESEEKLDWGLTHRFEGTEFLRAVAVTPKSDAAVQILALELYADGIVVCFGYDDPGDVELPISREPSHRREAVSSLVRLPMETEPLGERHYPSISVADDLGTIYRDVEQAVDGVDTVRCRKTFTPAAPSEAKWLKIASCAGVLMVEL